VTWRGAGGNNPLCLHAEEDSRIDAQLRGVTEGTRNVNYYSFGDVFVATADGSDERNLTQFFEPGG
jgi:hypothetical protein